MSIAVRAFLVVAIPLVLLPTSSAVAQRGELIEGLFRTIAEAQLERERMKQAERQRQAVEVCSRPLETSPTLVGPVNLRSREAAEFVGNLARFQADFDLLVQQLHAQASQQQHLRRWLPEAYAISADGQALIRRCEGLSPSRADRIRRSQQELVPYLARLTADLIER